MKVTTSANKADVGSIGGHTKPSEKMLDAVRQSVSGAIASGLLIDGFVSHTGDDIAILTSHTHGEGAAEVHRFAWETFLKATKIAQEYGLYGAGQNLPMEGPSGNLRSAGPGVAEIELEHTLTGVRPAESFKMLAADKCGRGAYNLPLFLGFADPLYCLPLVSCIGFSMDRAGRFSNSYVDFFDNPAWHEVGQRAQRKAIEMRSQGWSGAAMLPYAELEYGGFRETVEGLLERYSLRGGSWGEGPAQEGSRVGP